MPFICSERFLLHLRSPLRAGLCAHGVGEPPTLPARGAWPGEKDPSTVRVLDRRERGPEPLTRALPQGHGLLSERAHQRCCPLCEWRRGGVCRRRGYLVWRLLRECAEPELGQVSHPECLEHVSSSCHFRLSICVSLPLRTPVSSVFTFILICVLLCPGRRTSLGRPRPSNATMPSLPAPPAGPAAVCTAPWRAWLP